MASELQPISTFGMAMGLFLIVLSIILMRWVGLRLTKDLIIGTIRTFLQLIVIGFLLEYIFGANRWYWVVGLLILMILVAAHTARERLKTKIRRKLFNDISLSILIGAGFTILWVNEIVINVKPWYHPQYIIPLAGMIIGNSMNSAALALDRFHSELVQRKSEIETLLALGATASKSAEKPMQAAILAAMIPNINAMMIVGIVSFPGMMTGQILAGQSPLSAVTYQIIVMLMLTCAAAITAVIIARLALKRSFNQAEQLLAES